MKNKKNILVMIIGIFIFTIMVGGVSYAYFVYNKDVATADLTSGNININFTKETNTFSFSNLQPMNDAIGMISPNYLEFTVTGTADIEAIKYELEIVPKSGNTIDTKYIKFYLTEYNSTNGSETVLASPFLFTELYDSLVNNGKGIYQDLIKGNDDGTSKNYEKKYRLRSWIDESYKSASSGTFAYGVYLYAINIDTENSHILTFDMGDNRTLSKVVTIGENYGSLPIPSKEGYNFLGWNGKNLINLRANQSLPSSVVADQTEKRTFIENTMVVGLAFNNYYRPSQVNILNISDNNISFTMSSGYGIGFPILAEENQKYSISYNISSEGETIVSKIFYQEDGTMLDWYPIYGVGKVENVTTTLADTYYFTLVLASKGINKTVNVSNVQVEEGDTATPYEPYYVTSNTEVTSWNTNMVLKAKYSWNNYRYNDEVQEITIHGGEMHDDYITLNGTSDWINVGQIVDKKEVSIQAVIKAEESDLTDGEHEIIANYESGGLGLILYNGYPRFQLWLQDYGYIYVQSDTTIDTTGVHDIAGTYDGECLKLYIDGILDSENDLSKIIENNNLSGRIKNPDNNTVMAIGTNPSGSNSGLGYFAGNIYSVRIYDYAIDDLKIRTNIRKDGFLKKYNS